MKQCLKDFAISCALLMCMGGVVAAVAYCVGLVVFFTFKMLGVH